MFRPVPLDGNIMNIVIAGPGAVGQALGGLLAQSGHNVTFLGREGSLTITNMNTHGVMVHYRDGSRQDFNVRARAVASLEGMKPVDLVLLTTKTYSTGSVLEALQPVVGAKTTLMSLQNGVESAERMQGFFRRGHVLGAFCFMGASLQESGIVDLVSSKIKVVVGDFKGRSTPKLEVVATNFERGGVEVMRSHDIQRDLWLKQCWNVAIFQWCALGDQTIGEFLSSAEGRGVAYKTMMEVVAVAQAKGINLTKDDANAEIERARTEFPGVTPSILQDVRAVRRLEHHAFSGYIVAQGKRHNIPTPMSDYLFEELENLDQKAQRRLRRP